MNFMSVLKKIERLRIQGKHEKVFPLLDKINAYEFLINKPWLIEKLEALPAYKKAVKVANEE